jgi:FixJ family two-component response regulator
MSQLLIAIVDDEEPVRNATKSLVRSLGYHASTFASADDFLKSEQVNDTSCLITDVQMPGLSGLDLQDRLGDWSSSSAIWLSPSQIRACRFPAPGSSQG